MGAGRLKGPAHRGLGLVPSAAVSHSNPPLLERENKPESVSPCSLPALHVRAARVPSRSPGTPCSTCAGSRREARRCSHHSVIPRGSGGGLGGNLPAPSHLPWHLLAPCLAQVIPLLKSFHNIKAYVLVSTPQACHCLFSHFLPWDKNAS